MQLVILYLILNLTTAATYLSLLVILLSYSFAEMTITEGNLHNIVKVSSYVHSIFIRILVITLPHCDRKTLNQRDYVMKLMRE